MAAETGPTPATDLEERSEEHSSSVLSKAVVLAAIVVAGVIVYGYLDMPGSGLIGVANKRLWDYLELLIVPAALALGVYWLNRRQDERDQQAEEERSKRERAAQAEQVERALHVENERAQDAAVQAYLDQLTQLLVTQHDQELIKMRVDDEVRQVIQARSEPLLRNLSATRRWSLILFLSVMGLLTKDRPLVSLAWADLRDVDGRGAPLQGVDLQGTSLGRANLGRANLSEANLRGADLSEANLRGANLFRANLQEAKLQKADLYSANLRDARLYRANLQGARLFRADLEGANLIQAELQAANQIRGANLLNANLRGANLQGAKLQEVNLQGADLSNALGVTREQLAQVQSHEGATMPDGQSYEDWLKSKGSGEDGKNSGS